MATYNVVIAQQLDSQESAAGASEQLPGLRWRGAAVAAFALIAFMYSARLGAGSLWDNSEPTYGEIVKELLRSRDWLTLHYNFVAWFIHPPLWFWTAGAAASVFGLNEFSLRLPSALAGLLSAYAVYRAGVRLYGERAGIIAALALGTSLEFIVLSRLAILDTMLLLFTTIASLWMYFAVHERDRRAFWIAILAAALGTLTKGPVAVVLPLLTVGVYALWSREPILNRQLPWAAGLGVYVIVAGSWFALETAAAGSGFLAAYFGLSNVGRFLSPFENQPGPFWYYIPLVVIGFFPYVAFLPKAIKSAWQARASAERYLLCSAAVPFVFYSLAQTKLPNYIAVIFPACALLVGRLFGEALERNSLRPLRGALLMLPVSLVLLTIALVLFGELRNPDAFRALGHDLSLLGWLVVPAAVATLVVTLLANRVWLAALGLSVMMGGFAVALIFVMLPRAEAFKPMKSFAYAVMRYWHPGDKIGVFGMSSGNSLLFYTEAHGITFVGYEKSDATPQQFFDQPARVLCVIRPKNESYLREHGIRLWVVTRADHMSLVTNKPWP
ncbi:MAG: glycosyltransferase family 39 protein [Candidatus Eremiobacteraeota bacterium]|nr:glycosyltransferase family 39 protein [Candidatus Eremiobacteraeota bacterium]